MIIPIHPFLLDVPLYALHQPACTHRDPGGNPLVQECITLPIRFLQSTLDDLGHNQGEPSPMLWATCLQSVPTQGHQELLHTGSDGCMAVATHGVFQCCSEHDAHGHQPKGAVVQWKRY